MGRFDLIFLQISRAKIQVGTFLTYYMYFMVYMKVFIGLGSLQLRHINHMLIHIENNTNH